jgi:3-deoxy-D-manno-octulosonic-acid transferase
LQLGAERAFATGNLKFDVMPPPADAHAMAEMKRAISRPPAVSLRRARIAAKTSP